MKDSYQPVKVECISGHKADERPISFVFEGYNREITEIMDRWYEGGTDPARPTINYFKVRTVKGLTFLLRYIPDQDEWSVMPLPQASNE